MPWCARSASPPCSDATTCVGSHGERGRSARSRLRAVACAASAQDIEPRAYSNAPVGVNFLIAGGVYTRGGLSFDPSLPVTDENLRTSSAVLAYARVLDLWGMSGKFDVIAPYTWLSGSANYNGAAGRARRQRLRRSGVPAVDQPLRGTGADAQGVCELRAGPDRRRKLAGDRSGRSVRRRAHRQHRNEPMVVQAGDRRVEGGRAVDAGSHARRDLLHRQYGFLQRGHPVAGPALLTPGSRDLRVPVGDLGVVRHDLLRRRPDDTERRPRAATSSRTGAWARHSRCPVDLRNSVKLYASSGVSARTGNSFDLIGIAWQHRWGGGL